MYVNNSGSCSLFDLYMLMTLGGLDAATCNKFPD